MSKERPLTDNQQRFVDEYLADPDSCATAAYRKAYPNAKPGSVSTAASILMKHPGVKAAIDAAKAERRARLQLTADDVLRDLYLVATADVNELVEHVRGACRYCHGYDHRRQYTPAEYREALANYIHREKNRKLEGEDDYRDTLGTKFPIEGGVGYDPRLDPHPDCPECFGRGEGFEFLKDSRKLSEAGRALYAGVKPTRNGTEMLMRSKDAARDLAARHLGVVRSSVEVTGKNGGPLKHAVGAVVATPVPVDPIEAAKLYADIMKL